MMTALLSVGAWATDDLTLNVSETVAFGEWGFSKSDNTVTINDWADGGGWVFDTALSKNDYYGVDFTFGAATTEEVKLIIVYNDATPTTQEIAVPSGSTNIHAVFNTNEDIKKIGFKMSVEGHQGDYSTNITITSAVVKAWTDGNLSIKVPGVNENSTITLGQWATNDTWVFGKTLSQDNYSGIDLTFSKTTAKITLQITYANDAVQNYEIPANSTHVAVGFDFNGNISKIGFKHNDYSNGNPVSITITSAVILSSTTGDEVDVKDAASITVNQWNYNTYKTFDPAINIDDYEKVVFTFSSVIPEDALSLQAKIKDGNAKTIGSLIKNGSKVTGYFSNMSSATIESLGFRLDWNEAGTSSVTLSIASAKLYKKPTKSITIGSMTHGTVTASVTEAWDGKTVILTPVPDGNYELGTLTVTDGNSYNVTVTDNGDGTYYFIMPATAVTVNATFTHNNNLTLSTDKILCFNSTGGRVTATRYYTSSHTLYVGDGEHNGWDLTIGRTATTEEFTGVTISFTNKQNIQLEIAYNDGSDKTYTKDLSSENSPVSINFSTAGITGVLKSIMFARKVSDDSNIVFTDEESVKMQIVSGATYPTPRSSMTLTYETLEDTGNSSVTYDTENKTFTITGGDNAHWAFWDFILPLPTSLYNGINFNLTQAPAGSKIEIIYADGTTQQVNIESAVSSEKNFNVNFAQTGNVTRIRFAGAGTYKMGTCTAKPAKYQVTVSTAKYATFGDLGSPDVIDYGSADPSGLKAYIAYVEDNKVKLTEVKKVPANTAVVLYADVTVATSYTVTTTNESADNVSANELKISDGTVEGNESTIYVLADGTHGVGFYLLQSGDKLAAGKAYLKVPGDAARQFIGFGDDNETTGIQTVANSQQSAANSYYDLQGRRVAQPTKGLYIVNGKKVIIK